MSTVNTRVVKEARVDWFEANQRHLSSALVAIREALMVFIAKQRGETPDTDHLLPEPYFFETSALETLCQTFGLSSFERNIVLLCAGMDMDGKFSNLCTQANLDPQRAFPTFGMALAALPDAHWSALSPVAPLRRWKLIELGTGNALTLSSLRIDERILHHLAGVNHIDSRLAVILEPLREPTELVQSHQDLCETIITAWSRAKQITAVIQLCGTDASCKRGIAFGVTKAFNRELYSLNANLIPNNPSELETLTLLLRREVILGSLALVLDCENLDSSDQNKMNSLQAFVAKFVGPLFISSLERQKLGERSNITLEVRKPSTFEQRQVWNTALGDTIPEFGMELDHLIGQFNMNPSAIKNASSEALRLLDQHPASDVPATLWEASRSQARQRLDDLAQRLETQASWEDLVLPEAQGQVLQDISAHVRQRLKVYETWGFGKQGSRGLGISALFAGTSGTGKTMAAEVIAKELRLDLYRIDLSTIVSKYIGETEKNLRRIFDAAEEGGAILLFDEADAIFGKRSDVKDSHDRYANIEVSYLLQRMESYRGLAVLTTNLKSAIDTAFMRRIRFVVQFPFPDLEQRSEIWRRSFPKIAPTQNLDFAKLGQLHIAGGNIRNTALNAAFIAADANEAIQMKHILHAAQSEYSKLEKQLTESETMDWV
jgi:ATPase family associated with various cellular activities (AAA)